MIESVPFTTRARTIDHLGREQIADCPTAVSELWKNAYDAYARNVSINIYDGDTPIATICDDGHGMSLDEIKEKWLVVGTESKATGSITPESDRNGLALRPKQGQKGIGRLSSGYLGSLLLLVSKREDLPFAVALIDWRLFENPYLLLQDISIPIASYETKEEIIVALPELYDRLMNNVWGPSNDELRKQRIVQAWEQFEDLERGDADFATGDQTTKEKLEATIIGASYSERHFKEWPLWSDTHHTGTALLTSNIDYSLECLINQRATDSISKHSRDRFFETLTGFSDPFSEIADQQDPERHEFNCSATVWHGDTMHQIIGENTNFNLSDISHLEHTIRGKITENGTFIGQVKTFGEWLEGDVTIELRDDVILPYRSDSKLGEFDLFIATAEWEPSKSTHTSEELARFKGQAELYSGFMMYRDGLRVMPYGRVDSDFFEIEQRRSKHAGREFWNHRRMFGRVAFTKDQNPNLRDKAGREGLVDNRASKALRDVVENILRESAKRYFGGESEYRNKILPELQDAYNKEKAEAEQKKLLKRKRKQFRSKLKKNLPNIRKEVEALTHAKDELNAPEAAQNESRVLELRAQVESYKERREEYQLGTAPKTLGSLAEDYKSYRQSYLYCQELVTEIEKIVQQSLEAINPLKPGEIIAKDLQAKASYLGKRTANWARQIKALWQSEKDRIDELINSRSKLLTSGLESIIDDVDCGRVPLNKALSIIEAEKDRLDSENKELFEPYLAALEYLQESIDIQGLATYHSEESSELREELNRLNELAQLGITVEIVGHELEDFDATIGSGLSALPEEVKNTLAYDRIQTGYHGLTERLRFLSPLKLSGERIQRWITGTEIHEYLLSFFNDTLTDSQIKLETTEAFKKIKVYDLPSRILPVFINLVNNSIYWTNQSESARHIKIHVEADTVLIGDTGAGVEESDIKSLFTLFFTRKIRGGRGVGLYLCRSNLAASGHRIEYVTDSKKKISTGANFAIQLKGVEHE